MPIRRGALALVLLGGCSVLDSSDEDADGAAEHTRASRQAIVNGVPSSSAHDATVLVFLRADPPAFTDDTFCTGTLIAPRIVVTARHCVSRSVVTLTNEFACSVDGKASDNSAKIVSNRDPSTIYVFSGKERPPHTRVHQDVDLSQWPQPLARGLEIIDDASSSLCDHDIAFIILREPVADDIPIASIRIDSGPFESEALLAVGYGVTTTEPQPHTRQEREIVVQRVGPRAAFPVLPPNEFLFAESICEGDSGGPLYSVETGALVGVVSRGGNGKRNQATALATCIGDVENYGTKLAPFRDLIDRSFLRVGGRPKPEAWRIEARGSSCTLAPATASTPASAIMIALLLMVHARRRTRARES